MSSPSQITLLSVPQPTPSLPPPHAPNEALRYVTNATLIAAPVLLLVPPRKLDLYTLSLCALWAASAEHQIRVRSGQGVLQWAAQRTRAERAATLNHPSTPSIPHAESPLGRDVTFIPPASTNIATPLMRNSNARPTKLDMNEHIDPWASLGARLGYDGRTRVGILSQGLSGPSVPGASNGTLLENAMHAPTTPDTSGDRLGARGAAHQVWTGDETPGWKEQRMHEDQIDANDGLTVGDRILKQIWMVWNQSHAEYDTDIKDKNHEASDKN